MSTTTVKGFAWMDVQRHLVTMAEDGEYWSVQWKPSAREAEVQDRVHPSSIVVQESESHWHKSETSRTLERERSSWTWSLIIRFETGVTALLERFEDALTDHPARIDNQDGRPPLFLNLISASYSHPVRQGPASGTEATYTFEVVPHRK